MFLIVKSLYWKSLHVLWLGDNFPQQKKSFYILLRVLYFDTIVKVSPDKKKIYRKILYAFIVLHIFSKMYKIVALKIYQKSKTYSQL